MNRECQIPRRENRREEEKRKGVSGFQEEGAQQNRYLESRQKQTIKQCQRSGEDVIYKDCAALRLEFEGWICDPLTYFIATAGTEGLLKIGKRDRWMEQGRRGLIRKCSMCQRQAFGRGSVNCRSCCTHLPPVSALEICSCFQLFVRFSKAAHCV